MIKTGEHNVTVYVQSQHYLLVKCPISDQEKVSLNAGELFPPLSS
jgi:hypothetical protein